MGVSRTGRILAGFAMAALLVVSSPAHMAHAEDTGAFQHDLSRVSSELGNDPSYRRIPLEGLEDQQWFGELAYSLWQKKIGTAEFVSQGVARFPDYQDSFEAVAKRLAR